MNAIYQGNLGMKHTLPIQVSKSVRHFVLRSIMASKILCEYAQANGYESRENFFYREYNGYIVTLSEKSGAKILSIGISLPLDDPRHNQIVGFIENSKNEYKIAEYTIHPSYIRMSFQDNKSVMERVTDVLNNAVKQLAENGIPGSKACWYCNMESTSSSDRALIDGAVVNMHSGCFETFSRTVNEASNEFHKEKKNYFRGFIGALLGGLIGAIPWVIVYLLGYIAGILGFAIGFATKFGYEKLGGKPGRAKAWIIIAVVIFSVVLGQSVGDIIEIHNAFQNSGLSGYSIADLIFTYRLLVTEDAEIRLAFIKNILIGIVFAFASIYGIFKEAKKEGTGNFVSIKRLE